MNADTEISLDDLHQAILDKIAAQFPDLVTVDDYRDDRKTLPVPACLVELTDMEGSPENDPGTEQLCVLSHWEARIIIGFRTADAKREIRKLAGALGAFVHLQRWGLPVSPAEVTSIGPDEFSPELDRYEVWRVEWQQRLNLGKSVWDNDGTIPTQVLVSWSPDIGPDHVDDYMPVETPEDLLP